MTELGPELPGVSASGARGGPEDRSGWQDPHPERGCPRRRAASCSAPVTQALGISVLAPAAVVAGVGILV